MRAKVVIRVVDALTSPVLVSPRRRPVTSSDATLTAHTTATKTARSEKSVNQERYDTVRRRVGQRAHIEEDNDDYQGSVTTDAAGPGG
jgi:hypothetical protein